MGVKRHVAAVAVLTAAGVIAGVGTALAATQSGPAAKGPKAPKEARIVGDAWVKFPGDPQYPYRRFTVDAHGNPWKFVNGKMTFGAAQGTVTYDHYAPDVPGGPSKHHYGTIKVDYVMTGGPVAVVSGIRQDNVPANQRRGNLTFYQSPEGHRFDRMGFSWGVVDPRCQQMGTGPAPFSPVSAGPDGHWLKGYTVNDAPLPIPTGTFLPPDNPANCRFDDPAGK